MNQYFLLNTVRPPTPFNRQTATSPVIAANEFPSSFESIVRKIVRLLFHVVAHLYAAHFKEVVMLGLHAHLNLTFAHLTALHRRFGLVEPKETEVLRDLEVALRLTEEGGAEGAEQVEEASEAESRTQGDKSNGERLGLESWGCLCDDRGLFRVFVFTVFCIIGVDIEATWWC